MLAEPAEARLSVKLSEHWQVGGGSIWTRFNRLSPSLKIVPRTVTYCRSLAHLLVHTLMNAINQNACCLPITEFIVVFLKWFHWPCSPQTEFHIGDHIENTVFCKMVKSAHLFLFLLTCRQGNGQIRPSPCYHSYQCAMPARESHLIYFWRLFPFAKRKTNCFGESSLVAQWLRIHLPMQGTWVRALVQEDPTGCGATKPMCHNYWTCALEPASHNYWAHVPQLLKPVHLEPVLHNKRSHHNEKPTHHNEE